MAPPPEITYLVTYRCPRCGAALEAAAGRSSSWLKCPKCKRASLPPEYVTRPAVRDLFPAGGDVLVIGPETIPAMPAGRPAPRPPAARPTLVTPDPFSEAEPVSVRRVALTSVLFISVMMILFSYLSQNTLGTSIASASSLICLILLVMPTRS